MTPHGYGNCNKCGLPMGYEKIITPDGKAYHMNCWSKEI